LKDDRTITGQLICFDRLQNVILMDALEERRVLKSLYHHYHTNDDGGGDHGGDGDGDQSYYLFRREISQVLVPGEKIVKVEIEKDHYLFNQDSENI
jgi:small nuclear ribonucleoprotein (snRNP)-like protein